LVASERETALELEEEVRALERRLREGEEVIRRGREAGAPPDQLDRWEKSWIKLLRQYELKCDRLARHLVVDEPTVET
jgi:hypothetical protein